MKKLTILLMTALTMTTCVVACATRANDVAGATSTDREVKNYSLRDFSRVEVSGTVRVFIAQGDHYGVRVRESANPNLLTVVEKHGQTLHIYTKSLKKNISLHGDKDTPVVYLIMPALSEVTGSGTSEVNVAELKTDAFSATISGASALKMERLSGQAVNLKCSGASKVMAASVACTSMQSLLTGASKLEAAVNCSGNMKVDCSGASKQQLTLKADRLTITNSGASKSVVDFRGGSVEARNSGAGKMDLTVDCKHLKATNSGASKFVIGGTADQTDIDLSGVSKIDTRNLNKY